MNIYFDEAGNSGQNLLDSIQPIYVLVSHNFSMEEAKKILAPIKSNAKEIHFKNIKKYSKNHKSIEYVLNNPSINYNRIKIAYANKKYALCAHLVDQLVETTYYNKNQKFYEGGLNIIYAQSLYLHAEYFDQKIEYSELLLRFQKMIREKNQTSIDTFYEKASEIYNNIPESKHYEKNFFSPILQSRKYINDILETINIYSIDLALPFIAILSDVWAKSEKSKINIIHDDSKQIIFWREYIKSLSKDMILDKAELGFDERKMVFPLQINSLELVDSKDSLQIQLSDLIGSVFAYYAKNILLKNDENDEFAKIISKTKLAQIEVHPLQPDLSFFEKEFTEGIDDLNPLDFLAEFTLNNTNKS